MLHLVQSEKLIAIYIIYVYTNSNTVNLTISLNTDSKSICHMQGETKKAQLVSVLGIIVGSIITAAAIAVLVLYVTGRIG